MTGKGVNLFLRTEISEITIQSVINGTPGLMQALNWVT